MSVPSRDTNNDANIYPSRSTTSTNSPVSNASITVIPRTGASVRPSGSVDLYPTRTNVQTLANTTAREGFTSVYGKSNPFEILADLFLRTSTGFDPAPPANAGVIAVDPGVSGSGGNTILITLVLGIAAVAIWYFYFR